VAHDHDHDHNHNHAQENGARDPQEQEGLARELGNSLTDSFVDFVRGDITFDTLIFESFETIQDLFVIASGDYELEFVEDSGDEDEE
jgi:hypothetical protein